MFKLYLLFINLLLLYLEHFPHNQNDAVNSNLLKSQLTIGKNIYLFANSFCSFSDQHGFATYFGPESGSANRYASVGQLKLTNFC